MPTVATPIYIDSKIKSQADVLFKEFGLDLSTAINNFLRLCVLNHSIPFSDNDTYKYSDETMEAMNEALAISDDPSIKSYDTMDELKKALLD